MLSDADGPYDRLPICGAKCRWTSDWNRRRQWSSAVGQTSKIQSQCIVAHDESVGLVAFRGTLPQSTPNWLTDADLVPTREEGPVAMLVHRGLERRLLRSFVDRAPIFYSKILWILSPCCCRCRRGGMR